MAASAGSEARIGVLVVDDEPLARQALCDLVAADSTLELFGSCGDGDSARSLINQLRPDLLLLDIEMPGVGGLQLVQDLPEQHRPMVIFVTAYQEHALRAFELKALDYLLKPFSDARFAEATGRARRRILERRMALVAEALASGRQPDLGTAPAPGTPNRTAEHPVSAHGTATKSDRPAVLRRLPVRRGGRQLLVDVERVIWFESDDYCVRLHVEDGKSHLIRASLNRLEKQLDSSHFARVHRGAIVALSRVLQIQNRPSGGRVLELEGGHSVPVARSRVKQVEGLLLPPAR